MGARQGREGHLLPHQFAGTGYLLARLRFVRWSCTEAAYICRRAGCMGDACVHVSVISMYALGSSPGLGLHHLPMVINRRDGILSCLLELAFSRARL